MSRRGRAVWPLLLLAWLIQTLAPIGAALAMARVDPLADAIICISSDDAAAFSHAPAKLPPVKIHRDCVYCQVAHADLDAGPDPHPGIVARLRAFELAEWIVAAAYRPPPACNDQSRPRAPPRFV